MFIIEVDVDGGLGSVLFCVVAKKSIFQATLYTI